MLNIYISICFPFCFCFAWLIPSFAAFRSPGDTRKIFDFPWVIFSDFPWNQQMRKFLDERYKPSIKTIKWIIFIGFPMKVTIQWAWDIFGPSTSVPGLIRLCFGTPHAGACREICRGCGGVYRCSGWCIRWYIYIYIYTAYFVNTSWIYTCMYIYIHTNQIMYEYDYFIQIYCICEYML